MSGVRVSEQELLRFASAVLEAVDVPSDVAHTVADNLVQGELHGLASHGVSRLLEVYAERFAGGGINPRPNIQVVHRDRGAALIDGDSGPGAVAGTRAMSLAIELARGHGSGWVAVRNSSHFGAAFLYARMAMAQGMIGFATTNAVVQVAPYGGRTKMLGTNPLCVGVPGGKHGPVLLDMATSQAARGKVQVAAINGESIPLGWAVDRNDQPTTDPNNAWRLLPLGGYKGYGLALLMEILSAVVSGAMVGTGVGQMFNHPSTRQGIGHMLGALDVSAFGSLQGFQDRMDDLIEYIKSGELEEGGEILLPGEPEARAAAANRQEGIPLSADVYAIMERLAAQYRVAPLQTR
ncbi:MAG: Ldh family oxidoreductase [Anaerolineae bacterium]|jgi:LDH2 family malate/lactate/ureidoglycolate dehydrogenase|nr:Ldh family oxidoreductase [Chloroflexota bacterium]